MKFYICFFSVLCAVLLISAFRVLRTGEGITHTETCGFVIHYNDPATPSFGARIFNPLQNDWGCYQARELSYVIDFLDARFIAHCIRKGHPHMQSLSFPFFLLLIAAAQQLLCKKLMPGVKAPVRILLTLVFVSCASSEACFRFFRCSKPAAALAITLALYGALGMLREPGKKRWMFLLGIGLLGGSLCDRQGFFAAGAFAGAFGVGVLLAELCPQLAWSRQRSTAMLRIALVSFAVTAFCTWYNLQLAPAVIRYYHHYAPSFEYQHVPVSAVFSLGSGFYFLSNNLSYQLFRLPELYSVITGALLTLGIPVCVLWQWKKGKCTSGPPLALLALAGAMFLCANLMTGRHELIINPDVIHTGYFLPFAAVCVFFAALLTETFPAITHPLTALLGIALLCNLLLVIPAPVSEDSLAWHVKTSRDTFELLRHPEKDYLEKPLPHNSLELIRFFRGEGSAVVDFKGARP